MTPHLELSANELLLVQEILRRHLPDREILVFGSRATQKAKPFSDLDLAILGNQPVPSEVMADLKEAFDESVLSFKVDLLEWVHTDESFRQIIAAQAVPLPTTPRAAPSA
jgi:uncharacterized protein